MLDSDGTAPVDSQADPVSPTGILHCDNAGTSVKPEVPKRRRRMKRRRHFKTPKPPKPKPKTRREHSNTRPPIVLENPEALEDPLIQDLLKDVGKPIPEQSPLFHRLIHPGVGKKLTPDEQRMRETLVLAVVMTEGGWIAPAAKRLKMDRSTIAIIVDRHQKLTLETPEIMRERVEHARRVERKIQDEVESIADTFIEINRLSNARLINMLKDAKVEIPPATLSNISKSAAEKALLLAGLGPKRLGVRGAEKALSDAELEEESVQNAAMLAAMNADPALKVVEGGA